MTAFLTDFDPVSTQENDVERAILIVTDDGTPYEYEGGLLTLNVGARRVAGDVEPIFSLTSEDEEMEWRTDEDGNVYPTAIFPATKIEDLDGKTYLFDMLERYGTRVRRIAKGTIPFDNGVSEP